MQESLEIKQKPSESAQKLSANAPKSLIEILPEQKSTTPKLGRAKEPLATGPSDRSLQSKPAEVKRPDASSDSSTKSPANNIDAKEKESGATKASCQEIAEKGAGNQHRLNPAKSWRAKLIR